MGNPPDPLCTCVVLFQQVIPGFIQTGADFYQRPAFFQTDRISGGEMPYAVQNRHNQNRRKKKFEAIISVILYQLL